MSNELARRETWPPHAQGFPGNGNRPGVRRQLSRFGDDAQPVDIPALAQQLPNTDALRSSAQAMAMSELGDAGTGKGISQFCWAAVPQTDAGGRGE